MPTYGMGSVMREVRIRRGYTQEEVAYGICSTGTLSRIENGKSIMSKKVFEALCARLPGIDHIYISCDTKREMQRSKLCKQILFYLEHRKMKKAKESMEEYHCLKEKDNPFCEQFELYTQAIYHAILKEKEEEILPKLERALEITMPDFRERLRTPKKIILLTYDEIYILANMGIAYAKQQELELAFQIFYCLKLYAENKDFDVTEATKIYLMIFGNLAWILEQQGRFDEAVKQCDAAIEICYFTGKYTALPHLLCIKAWCLTASGNLKTAKKSRQQAETILDLKEEYRGYGSFEEFYKAKDPIFVTF